MTQDERFSLQFAVGWFIIALALFVLLMFHNEF
jgi:hypothetical protein